MMKSTPSGSAGLATLSRASTITSALRTGNSCAAANPQPQAIASATPALATRAIELIAVQFFNIFAAASSTRS